MTNREEELKALVKEAEESIKKYFDYLDSLQGDCSEVSEKELAKEIAKEIELDFPKDAVVSCNTGNLAKHLKTKYRIMRRG